MVSIATEYNEVYEICCLKVQDPQLAFTVLECAAVKWEVDWC